MFYLQLNPALWRFHTGVAWKRRQKITLIPNDVDRSAFQCWGAIKQDISSRLQNLSCGEAVYTVFHRVRTQPLLDTAVLDFYGCGCRILAYCSLYECKRIRLQNRLYTRLLFICLHQSSRNGCNGLLFMLSYVFCWSFHCWIRLEIAVTGSSPTVGVSQIPNCPLHRS